VLAIEYNYIKEITSLENVEKEGTALKKI